MRESSFGAGRRLIALDGNGIRLWSTVLEGGDISGYLGAGLWIVARQRATRLGLLTVSIGCGLFFTCWLFSSTPIVYTLGLMFGLLWLPIVVHLVLAFPSGHLRRPAERALAGFSYAAAVVLQPLPWLFWDGDWEAVSDRRSGGRGGDFDLPRPRPLVARPGA